MNASTRDPRIREYVVPVRIVWQTTGSAAPTHPDVLLEDRPGQCAIAPQTLCVLENSGHAPGILLDFGRASCKAAFASQRRGPPIRDRFA